MFTEGQNERLHEFFHRFRWKLKHATYVV
jgi:hypothetical protein